MSPTKRERGRPRKPPTKIQNVTLGDERVGVRMDLTLAAEVARVAKREGVSVSELMRACVYVLVECKCPAMLPHVRIAMHPGEAVKCPCNFEEDECPVHGSIRFTEPELRAAVTNAVRRFARNAEHHQKQALAGALGAAHGTAERVLDQAHLPFQLAAVGRAIGNITESEIANRFRPLDTELYVDEAVREAKAKR